VWLGNVTARPSPQQLAWHAAEVGAMVTFNLQSQAACTSPKATNASAQACQAAPLRVPDWEAVTQWGLTRLDTDLWVGAAAAFGARYAVLTVDHMTGFALWPTRVHNASVASVAWAGGKGDVVASFHTSCTKRGVGPSLFYSTHYNWVLGVNNYEEGWPRLYGGPPLTQAQYAASAGAQLEELQSGYGPWFEVWFDGGIDLQATPELGPLVRGLFPSALCHSCPGFSEGQPGSPGSGVRVGTGLGWRG
jgi:alpha-L-fucosidase